VMVSRAARFSPTGMQCVPGFDKALVLFLTAIRRSTSDAPGDAIVPPPAGLGKRQWFLGLIARDLLERRRKFNRTVDSSDRVGMRLER
jgi:hypothetical protein